jgi:hypothetical protein
MGRGNDSSFSIDWSAFTFQCPAGMNEVFTGSNNPGSLSATPKDGLLRNFLNPDFIGTGCHFSEAVPTTEFIRTTVVFKVKSSIVGKAGFI